MPQAVLRPQAAEARRLGVPLYVIVLNNLGYLPNAWRQDKQYKPPPVDASLETLSLQTGGRLFNLAGTAELRLLNRTRGAGTRVLLDLLLEELARDRGVTPDELRAGIGGYEVETRSHNAVAAAVASGRADWGLGIEAVAVAYDLGFAPLRDEEYDFLSLRNRLEREPVKAFLEVLRSSGFRKALAELPGFAPDARTGEPESLEPG